MTDQPTEMGKAAEFLQSVAKPLATFLGFVIPPLFSATAKAYKWFSMLPKNVAQFLIGFCFCFFGGLYPTVFAAVQAAEHGGRKSVVQAVSDLAKEIMVILEESKKDDAVDANKVSYVCVESIGINECFRTYCSCGDNRMEKPTLTR